VAVGQSKSLLRKGTAARGGKVLALQGRKERWRRDPKARIETEGAKLHGKKIRLQGKPLILPTNGLYEKKKNTGYQSLRERGALDQKKVGYKGRGRWKVPYTKAKRA